MHARLSHLSHDVILNDDTLRFQCVPDCERLFNELPLAGTTRRGTPPSMAMVLSSSALDRIGLGVGGSYVAACVPGRIKRRVMAP